MKRSMEDKDLNQQQEEKKEQPESQGQANRSAETKPPEAEKQAEYYKDLFLRKAAEFDNYKRRSEAENLAVVRFANEDLITSILPIVDDLERSLKNSKDQKDSPLVRGIELIHLKMMKILEAQGVRPFETLGKEFDVHFHDAMLQMPKEGVPPHTIIEEVQKGYMFHEKVLRHAKVIVAAESAADQQSINTASDAGNKPDQE